MDEAVGPRLRALRAQQNLRQAEVAAVLGISRSRLANIEAGREAPGARLLAQIAQRYPSWREHLQPGSIDLPDDAPAGGPFVLEELTLAYLFDAAWPPAR